MNAVKKAQNKLKKLVARGARGRTIDRAHKKLNRVTEVADRRKAEAEAAERTLNDI